MGDTIQPITCGIQESLTNGLGMEVWSRSRETNQVLQLPGEQPGAMATWHRKGRREGAVPECDPRAQLRDRSGGFQGELQSCTAAWWRGSRGTTSWGLIPFLPPNHRGLNPISSRDESALCCSPPGHSGGEVRAWRGKQTLSWTRTGCPAVSLWRRLPSAGLWVAPEAALTSEDSGSSGKRPHGNRACQGT